MASPMPDRTSTSTALHRALQVRLEQWRARLRAQHPDAAIWAEVIDTTRAELRLLLPVRPRQQHGNAEPGSKTS